MFTWSLEYGNHEDEVEDGGGEKRLCRLQSTRERMSLDDGDVDEHESTENEEEPSPPKPAAADHIDEDRDLSNDLLCPTEGEKKKERRNERKMLEREGKSVERKDCQGIFCS